MCSARVFLAVPLPRQLQAAVLALQQDLRTKIPGARWTRPDSLHLTLHFFGDTSQETLEKIKVSVLSVKRRQRPFAVEIKGLGAFPNRRRARIIWLGLDPGEPLIQLYGVCRKLLHRAGVDTDTRPYAPHLTIGRLRRDSADLTAPDLKMLCDSYSRVPLGVLPVDRLVLFESRLHPDGAEHIPLLTVHFNDEIDSEQQNNQHSDYGP